MKRSLLLAILLLFIFQFSYTQNKWSYKYRSGEPEQLTELQGLQAFNGYNFFIVEFKELPQSDQQIVLKQNGVELLGYLDHKHYWARIQTNSLSEIKLNALKINRIAVPDNTLKSNPFFEALVNNAEPGSFVIKLWSKEDIPLLIQVLEKDFEVSAAVISESRGLLEINISTEQLNDILQLPPVAYIGPLARTAIPLLVNTINMNRVNALQSEDFGPGLSGEGVTVGLWDGGVTGNHVDLNGRVQNIENSFININETKHATSVAGIIGGKGHKSTRVIGMAPEANIKVWTFDGDIIQEMNDGVDNESLNIINSSYMLNDYNDPKFEMCVYPGLYVLESAELDKMVRDHPTLTHTIANGNDQATCSVVGVPTRQGIPIGLQSAKNVINVGWIDQAETHVGGSNIGPTLDGRWKPEIMSKGKVVTTTGVDNEYDNTQGSSFSTPNVAGTTALLYEWYFDQFGVYPNAALIRGVLCNTAEDLYTQNGASHIGPDFFHGFGRINGLRAYDVLQDGSFEEDAISNNQQKTFNITIPANVGSVNVALAWSDVEAIPGDLTPLVNNLDLTVVGPDSTYLPWVIFPRRFWISAQTGIDSINNIEQVTINDPIPGTYTVTVTGTEIPFGPQDFAINYDIREKGVELTHPIGGEQWVPGETQYIRWDHSRTGANFTIDISYDDGATWTTIRTAGVRATYTTWAVKDTTSHTCRMRITSGAYQNISERFTIMKRVTNITGIACDNYVSIQWDPVAAADAYKVLLLDKTLDEYVQVDSTVDTFFVMSNVLNGEEYWLAVVALDGTNEALRSNGYLFSPSSSIDCNFTDDIGVYSICAPLGFRYTFNGGLPYSGAFEVVVKNYSNNAVTGFDVCYQREGDAPVCESYLGTLAPNSSDTLVFTAMESFADTIHYQYKLWTSYNVDSNHNNDTIPATIKVVTSHPLPLPYENDFEGVTAKNYLSKYFAVDDMEEWDFYAGTADGRLSVGRLDQFAFESDQAVTLDRYAGTGFQSNEAILNLNLTGYQDSTIYFDLAYINHGETAESGDKIWARADDSEAWIEIFNFGTNLMNANYKFIKALNLTDILVTLNGQTFGDNFQLKIGQEGNGKAIFVNANEGRSFDNVKVYNVGDDIELLSVKVNGLYCDSLPGSFPVTLVLKNNSMHDVTNVTAAYSISTGQNEVQLIPSILAGETLEFTFTNEADYTPGEIITLEAFVNYASDKYALNDSITNIEVIIQPYANAVFYDDLESDEILLNLGSRSSWEWGMPTNAIISEAASGSNAWATNLDGYYNHGESSYLYSPCFNFSKYLTNPNVAFNMKLNVETDFDYFTLEYTEDGLNWKTLKAEPEAYNWFNGGINFWDEDVLEWTTTSNNLNLDDLSSKSNVSFRYRFESDNFTREEGAAIDDINIMADLGQIHNMTADQTIVALVNSNEDWTTVNTADEVLFGIQGTSVEALNLGIYKESAPISFQDKYMLERHFWIDGEGSFRCRLYLPYSEYETFLDDIPFWSAPSQMAVLAYSGNNIDHQLVNNEINYQVIKDDDLDIKPYRNGYILEFDADGNSEFYIYSETLIDPALVLNSFEASSISQNTAQLEWSSIKEGGTDGFVVEVSIDGNNYDSLLYVSAIGTDTTGETYLAFDSITQKDCIMHYRLSGVDASGNKMFLAVDTAGFILLPVMVTTGSCNPADTGFATLDLTSSTGCDSTVMVTTFLLASYDTTFLTSSCNPADTGTVVENLTSTDGCDSTITTVTSLLSAYDITLTAESCNPADTGTVVQNLTSTDGCDSTVTTVTTLLSAYDITLTAESCNPADTGTVVQNLTSTNGCDSVVTTVTTLLSDYDITLTAESCNPADTGTVIQNLTSTDGCDSTVTTVTTLLSAHDITLAAESCNPADTGTVVQNLTSTDGCDSTVTMVTSLLSAYDITLTAESCNPVDTGTVVQNLTSTDGCDSTVTLVTTLLSAYDITLAAESCNPADTGTVVQNLTSSDGCDSTVTTVTTLLSAYDITVTAESCNPADTGTVVQYLTSTDGCDSTVTMITTLLESYDITVQAVSCDPNNVGTDIQNLTAMNGCDSTVTTITVLGTSSVYTIHETTCDPQLAGTTTYTFYGGASNGCDSVVTVITALLPKAYATIHVATCEEDEAGIIRDTVYGGAFNGCDSIVTTIIEYVPPVSSTIYATTCDPELVGETITIISGGAESGCDSIVTTVTSLLPINNVVVNETTCDENSAGLFTEVFTNQFGCDSTVRTLVQYIPPPVAAFIFSINGLEVTFENTSDNDDANGWILGDGTILTNSNYVEHQYENVGTYEVVLGVANPCGADSVSQSITLVNTAIDLNTLIESMVLYPNPNNGQFALEFKGKDLNTNIDLQLVDVTGKVVDARTAMFNGYLKVNYAVATFPSGTYLLHIKSKEGVTTLKVNIVK